MEVPQGSVLGPLFFLVCINDPVSNVNFDIILIATDLFSVATDEARTGLELNHGLEHGCRNT